MNKENSKNFVSKRIKRIFSEIEKINPGLVFKLLKEITPSKMGELNNAINEVSSVVYLRTLRDVKKYAKEVSEESFDNLLVQWRIQAVSKNKNYSTGRKKSWGSREIRKVIEQRIRTARKTKKIILLGEVWKVPACLFGIGVLEGAGWDLAKQIAIVNGRGTLLGDAAYAVADAMPPATILTFMASLTNIAWRAHKAYVKNERSSESSMIFGTSLVPLYPFEAIAEIPDSIRPKHWTSKMEIARQIVNFLENGNWPRAAVQELAEHGTFEEQYKVLSGASEYENLKKRFSSIAEKEYRDGRYKLDEVYGGSLINEAAGNVAPRNYAKLWLSILNTNKKVTENERGVAFDVVSQSNKNEMRL